MTFQQPQGDHPGQQPNGIQPLVIQLPPQGMPQPAPGSQPQVVALEDAFKMVEMGRGQERQKMHDENEELRKQVALLAEERERRIAEEQTVQQQETAAAEAARREEMSAKDLVAQQNTFWDQKFSELTEELARERVLRQKEQEFHELNNYRTAAIAANQDKIADEFMEYIGGNTREEIDTSIIRAIEKSSVIEGRFLAATQQQPGRPMPMMPVTGVPPVTPADLGQGTQQVLTAAQIAAMSPEEWAANRGVIMAAASERVRSQGLYNAP